MKNLHLLTDYKHNSTYRLSFNELAQHVFGIDFELWYQKGLWNERYVCYSYAVGNRIVANVSANLMDLVIRGEKKPAIQIGTVMTHPDYRGKGLAADLLNRVIEFYEKNYDLFYLFANETVLDFYPKFGFRLLQEYRYLMKVNPNLSVSPQPPGRKLDISKDEDFRLIKRLAGMRLPVSRVFCAEYTQSLLLWYCLNIFPNDLYYWKDYDLLLLATFEDETLHIHDLICPQPIDFQALLPRFLRKGIKKVEFHFTPDQLNIKPQTELLAPQELFIRTNNWPLENAFKYPTTAKA